MGPEGAEQVGRRELPGAAFQLYIVHMKRVTASEARKYWFRILDEVASGTAVVIERKGHRILLQREEPAAASREIPNYSELIRVPDAERADEWGWRWPGEEEELEPEDAR